MARFYLFPLLLFVVAACGKSKSAPAQSITQTCTSFYTFAIDSGMETEELTFGETQFRDACACATETLEQKISPDAFIAADEQLAEAAAAIKKVFEEITLYGTGDPKVMAAGLSEASTPARLAAVLGYWEGFKPCAAQYGIELPDLLSGQSSHIPQNVDSERLDTRLERACTAMMTGSLAPADLTAYPDEKIANGCGMYAFLNYHHYEPQKSENGKREMAHNVEVLESAAETPLAERTQFQNELIDGITGFLLANIDDIPE